MMKTNLSRSKPLQDLYPSFCYWWFCSLLKSKHFAGSLISVNVCQNCLDPVSDFVLKHYQLLCYTLYLSSPLYSVISSCGPASIWSFLWLFLMNIFWRVLSFKPCFVSLLGLVIWHPGTLLPVGIFNEYTQLEYTLLEH